MSDILEKARAMSPEDAEEYLLTMERLRRYRETGEGYTLEQVRDWMEARREDPDAPCPTAKPIR